MGRHPVEQIARDCTRFCLGPLIGQNSGLESPPDDGLVAKYRARHRWVKRFAGRGLGFGGF
jgi:hypothetical protein